MKSKQSHHKNNVISRYYVTVFYRKLYQLFSNAEKLETCRNLNLANFRTSLFGEILTCISYSPVLWVLNNFLYSIKKGIYLEEFYIWHRQLTVQIKHSHTLRYLLRFCLLRRLLKKRNKSTYSSVKFIAKKLYIKF